MWHTGQAPVVPGPMRRVGKSSRVSLIFSGTSGQVQEEAPMLLVEGEVRIHSCLLCKVLVSPVAASAK